MFTEFLNITPKAELLPDYDLKPETNCYGIKALCFEGAEYKGNKTKVFCHIGYPKGSEETKVPAIILVHGGGGHAYAEWVKIWNERGYAAIALDLCGCLPAKNQKGLVYTEWQRDEYFERWEDKDGFVAGPNDYLILDENEAIENVWFYSAIANTILAHNLLLADSRIDSAKIGITGVSWGGTITSQVIAYDRRFAFAIPIYGSGFLRHSFTKVNKQFKLSDSIKYWDISFKYPEIEFPVLWLCWNYDHCFDVLPNCYSYMLTKKSGAVLSICNEMGHGHVNAWVREESYRFADSVIADSSKFIRFKNDEFDFYEEKLELDSSTKGRTIEATLYYTTEEYAYNEKSEPNFKWKTTNAIVKENYVIISVPQDAKAYYLELKETIGGKEYISTSILKK